MSSARWGVWIAAGLVGLSLCGCSGSSPTKVDGGGGAGGAKTDGGRTIVDGGDEDGGTKTDGGGVGDACADYVAKYCDRLQACAPGLLPLSGFTSLADCASYFISACADALAAPHTAATRALFQQCGDGIAAMSCTDFVQGMTVAACVPKGGTIPIGGACENDWQCSSGRCWASFVDSCGTCAAVASTGEPCQVDASLGPVCPADFKCAVTPASGNRPVCATPVPIGAACAETQLCPLNAVCDPPTHRCTELPALGQACDAAIDVYSCDPTKSAAICGESSICVAVAAAKDGQPCGDVNGTETRCNGACTLREAGAGICHTFLPRGHACGTNDLCAFDTTCMNGICSSPVCGGGVASGTAAAPVARGRSGTDLDGRRAVSPPRRLPLGAGSTLPRP